MPLESHLPKIDDRTSEDIVADIRSLIPRYTNEWTDLNESDLGMTFIQLFAWLADMLIYRLGKVPELNRLKFLELLGIELRPAEPAIVEITFPLRDTHFESSLIVPQFTQVRADETDEQGPIIFETDKAITAIRSNLVSLQVNAGASFSLVTTENQEAEKGFQPFGPVASVGNSLLLGFTEEFPEEQIDLAVWVPEGDGSPAFVDCGVPSTATFASSEVVWEFWDGKKWTSFSILKDETLALTRTGHVLFDAPPVGEMKSFVIGQESTELFWIRVRLVKSAFDKPPKLLAVRTNTVRATQAETIRDEILGGSDGSPDQVFELDDKPVLAGSLQLEVDEGQGFQAWDEVGDFLASTRTSLHYVLNRTTGEIRFGDGLDHGAIPVSNPDRPTANVIARVYRIGGGTRGNLPAGSLTSLLSSLTGVDPNAITNVRPSHSGRDEESLDEAIDRAQASLKNRCRAVTEEDFEALAKQAANIKRAKALPLRHPDFGDIDIPGVVTVIVVPDVEDVPNPTPSEGTLKTVCEYLNQRRLLTAELYVAKPSYKLVEIRGKVVAKNTADLAEVKSSIEDVLLTYFHPLKGGEDGTGWPFGGDIFYSRVYQQVFSVTGVDRITSLAIWVDGEEQPPCEDVSIGEGVLVYSQDHGRIQVNYDATA